MTGDGEFLANGVWFSAASPGTMFSGTRAGLILDRDGVLVDEVGYLHQPQDVRLLDGAADFVRAANARQIPVAVVTNQSGISREYFGWPDFFETQREIGRHLGAQGATIDAVIACPFHPDHTPDWSTDHAYWRKPGVGMLELAAEHLNLNLSKSWLLGDTASDIGAACNARLAGAVHVKTGHGRTQQVSVAKIPRDGTELIEAEDIAQAIEILERF